MRCTLFLVVLSWMFSCEIEGLQHVFVQRGTDFYLDVKKHVELDKKKDFFWKCNTNKYVGKIPFRGEPVLFDSYEGRAEWFNYSLLLKNAQHNDSGDYTAVVTGAQEQRVAEYKVTVQDPVSPVELTVTPSSSDSCNITVTCSSVDLNISSTFRCDDQNCSQLEEKSLKDTRFSPSVTVYMQQDTIYCNHSNQVSWKQSNGVTKPQCEPEANNAILIMVISAAVVASVIIVAAITCCCCRRKKGMYRRENTENTVYAVPEVELKHCLEQNLDRESASTYCLVGSHTGPKSGPTEPKGRALPDSLYAQMESLPGS